MSIKNINQWFKQAMPAPTKDQQRVQLGVHAEEYSEGLAVISDGNSVSNNRRYDLILESVNAVNSQFANILKKNTDFNLVVKDRKELLDGLCDLIVTCVGVAYTQGFDIIGALEEVSASNDSKYVDGKAIFDDNGKIKKGPNFYRPNLDPFVGIDPTL